MTTTKTNTTELDTIAAHIRGVVQGALSNNDQELLSKIRRYAQQLAEELRPCPECAQLIEATQHENSPCTVEPLGERDMAGFPWLI